MRTQSVTCEPVFRFPLPSLRAHRVIACVGLTLMAHVASAQLTSPKAPLPPLQPLQPLPAPLPTPSSSKTLTTSLAAPQQGDAFATFKYSLGTTLGQNAEAYARVTRARDA